MKIKPLFIIFCVFIIIAQKIIFSDAILKIADQYPVMIFILPLIILNIPVNFEKPFLLVVAFLIGLTMDVFNDTLGINAFALVMLAYFRSSILALIEPRQGYKPGQIGFRSFGLGWNSAYIGLSFLVFSFSFFMVDAFTLVYLKKVTFSTIMSTIASLPFGVILLMIFNSE